MVNLRNLNNYAYSNFWRIRRILTYSRPILTRMRELCCEQGLQSVIPWPTGCGGRSGSKTCWCPGREPGLWRSICLHLAIFEVLRGRFIYVDRQSAMSHAHSVIINVIINIILSSSSSSSMRTIWTRYYLRTTTTNDDNVRQTTTTKYERQITTTNDNNERQTTTTNDERRRRNANGR